MVTNLEFLLEKWYSRTYKDWADLNKFEELIRSEMEESDPPHANHELAQLMRDIVRARSALYELSYGCYWAKT